MKEKWTKSEIYYLIKTKGKRKCNAKTAHTTTKQIQTADTVQMETMKDFLIGWFIVGLVVMFSVEHHHRTTI